MVVADLHVHTTNSDGTLTLATLREAAERAGIEAVAVTDHDRVHPDLERPLTRSGRIEIVHGIELGVTTGELRVDLLGYGVRRSDRLQELLETVQANRVERARQIVARVEDRLGVELAVDVEPGIHRTHIAHAIDRSDAPYDYRRARDELIGDGCPCHVQRMVPEFDRGRRVLSEACALVGLAHPLRYPDPERALALSADLDAVELAYPYDRAVDVASVVAAINDHDLVATGGSDAHDDRLGLAGVDRATYDRIRSRIRD
ncbi:PHP domain-containing protein [Natronorubrum sp. DTA28]|uniref:PHP domain-containing protein n=1 Tax=Natronorubrum sp. DTA28 TaxID=3447019 RepID=UPI003F845086